jgi:hypothetical protein
VVKRTSRTPGLDEAVRRFQELGSARVRDSRGYLLVRLPPAASLSDTSVVWNAFVALLSYSDVDELHPAQQPAWWVLAYESEVNNGGHDAFLEQYAGVGANATITALQSLGAPIQAAVLTAAVARSTATQPDDQEARGFDDLDAAFGAASPSLVDRLEKHLLAHSSDFILVISEDS